MFVETKNRLESLVYSLESMLDEQKDKIPAEEQEKMKAMIASANELKAKDGVTSEELEEKIKELTKETEELAKKFQAQAPEQGNPADMVEDQHGSTVDGEVIDADK